MPILQVGHKVPDVVPKNEGGVALCGISECRGLSYRRGYCGTHFMDMWSVGQIVNSPISRRCVTCGSELARGGLLRYCSSRCSILHSRYGMGPEAFSLMRSVTNCDACGQQFANSTEPHVDHCHSSLIIRGFLDGLCNRALGLASDDVSVLTSAAAYLTSWKTAPWTLPEILVDNLCVICGAPKLVRLSRGGKEVRYCRDSDCLYRGSKLSLTYGLDARRWRPLIAQQNGNCLICRRPLPGEARRIHVDHDHASGAVRALVHGHCNFLIGAAREDSERLLSLARYLQLERPENWRLPTGPVPACAARKIASKARAEHWDEWCDGLQRFVDKSDRLPKWNSDPDERRLYSWMSRQRSLPERTGLTAEQLSRFDAIAPAVGPDWTERREAISNFVAANGRLPSGQSAVPSERQLAGWLARHRRQPQLDESANGRSEWLESIGARSVANRWEGRMSELESFVARTRRMPSSSRPSERALAFWCSDQRRRRNLRTPDQLRRLDQLDPTLGFNRPNVRHDVRLSELHQFLDSNQRLPKISVLSERSLRLWFDRKRGHLSDLPAERARAISDVLREYPVRPRAPRSQSAR